MTIPPLDLSADGQTLTVSASQLSEVKNCPRRWLYKYLHRREPVESHAAREGGKAFDMALNLRCQTAGPVTDELAQAMAGEIEKGFAGLEPEDGEYRTAARYKEVLRAYVEHWKDDDWDVLGVQMPVSAELGAVQGPQGMVRVVFQGILDRLARSRVDGQVWIMDTKTMGRYSGQVLAGFENSSQAKGYCWALEAMSKAGLAVPGRVEGFILDAVVIRPPYKNEKYAASSKALPREEFHRACFRYTPERLDEWRRDALAWVETALGWHARGHFPQNESSCAYHYGKKCGYLDVCLAPDEQRELVLGMDLFQEYERGPLGETKEGGEVE